MYEYFEREEEREGCSISGAFSIVAFARRWDTSVCTNVKCMDFKMYFLLIHFHISIMTSFERPITGTTKSHP